MTDWAFAMSYTCTALGQPPAVVDRMPWLACRALWALWLLVPPAFVSLHRLAGLLGAAAPLPAEEAPPSSEAELAAFDQLVRGG